MSLFPSCWDLLDVLGRSSDCPGCGTHAPAWVRVDIDGLSILTHDGDLICPADLTFGALAAPEPLPVAAPLGVAA